jgi:plasmid stabilization system protein ParE
MSLIVSTRARADAETTIRFYNSKPERYGAAFQREFDRTIARIANNPRLYPLVEDGVPGREIREYFIARFSQRVIYLLNGDDGLVVAVIHSDAREGAWHSNLPQQSSPEAT